MKEMVCEGSDIDGPPETERNHVLIVGLASGAESKPLAVPRHYVDIPFTCHSRPQALWDGSS
jgi:hypothetical protein